MTMCAPVVQGYGLTETCAGSFISVPDLQRESSPCIPGSETARGMPMQQLWQSVCAPSASARPASLQLQRQTISHASAPYCA